MLDDFNPNIFEIDINLLEVECSQQPKLYFKYAELLAKAEKRLDESERKLKAIDAQIDFDIRKKEKLTEANVKSKIILNKIHQKQEKIIGIRQHKVRLLKGIVNSLEHRKSMIGKEVDLHGQKYYATPTPKQRNVEHLAEIKKQAIRRKGK
jgi:hypothetical protein